MYLRALFLVVPLSFILALVLTIMPLPDWASPWRPEWVAMTMLYWSMALPRRYSVGSAWVVGLLLDVAKGTLLGQHALALALITLIGIRLHQRIRLSPLWQQSISIGALLALYLLVVLWVHGISGRAPGDWHYWAPLLTSTLLWPVVFVTLRAVRRRWCLELS